MLEVEDVNALVRRYSHLDERAEAHEEWWGGAVSLDNFLEGGLVDFLTGLAQGENAQHRWRAWVVNTQCSWQRGSHWFTVVAGLRLTALESPLPQPVAKRLRGATADPPPQPTPRSKLGQGSIQSFLIGNSTAEPPPSQSASRKRSRDALHDGDGVGEPPVGAFRGNLWEEILASLLGFFRKCNA